MTHEQKEELRSLTIQKFKLEGEAIPPEPFASIIINQAIKEVATECNGIPVDHAEVMLSKLREEIKILSNPFHKELKALQELEKSMKMLGFTEVYQTLFNKFSQ